MSDLIKRQAVIDLLKKNVSKDIEEVVITDKHIKLIESIPTAYNVDEVVAELEKESDFFGGKPMGSLQKAYYCKGIDKAIYIVRKGGAT